MEGQVAGTGRVGVGLDRFAAPQRGLGEPDGEDIQNDLDSAPKPWRDYPFDFLLSLHITGGNPIPLARNGKAALGLEIEAAFQGSDGNTCQGLGYSHHRQDVNSGRPMNDRNTSFQRIRNGSRQTSVAVMLGRF
jgi:hypothetical protein